MSATAEDVFRLVSFVQDDLRGCQAKLVEIRAMLAAMNLPDAKVRACCPNCRVRLKDDQLADHLANVHGEAS